MTEEYERQYERRHAIRALLVVPDQQKVLLIHTLVPDTNKLIWLTPGGGLEAGEDELSGLIREVKEETGLHIERADGPVWHRRMRFLLHGKAWDQSEAFYWVPTEEFMPDNAGNPALDERDIFRGFRWWTLDEIKQASDEIFVPLAFAQHFERLLLDGLPEASYDVGR